MSGRKNDYQRLEQGDRYEETGRSDTVDDCSKWQGIAEQSVCCLGGFSIGSSNKCETKCEFTSHAVTTKIKVQNICCGKEADVLRSTLNSLKGVDSISVNVPSRIAIVRHKTCLLPKSKIVEILNEKHLGVSIIEQGHSTSDEQIRNSSLHFIAQTGILVVISMLYLLTIIASLYKMPWMHWVALALIGIGCIPISMKIILNFRKKVFFEINLLVLIAVIGIVYLQDFLEGATVVFVFQIAGLLQEFCLYKVQKVLSELVIRTPNKAVIAETKEIVDIDAVKVGTVILICGGDNIPLDGIVVKGNGNVDESSITGESIPILKKTGDIVYSGTILQNGFLEVKTNSTGDDSTMSLISDMVLQAQGEATDTELMINKFAKIYTPLILIAALLVFIIPLLLSVCHVTEYNIHLLSTWGRRSLTVLLIACPCALLMSVPMPIFCAITAAARNGVLVKGGSYMETLAAVKTIAFDKTGTLTEGRFQVTIVQVLSEELHEQEIMRFVAALKSKSNHPIAIALVSHHLGCVCEFYQNQSESEPVMDVTKLQIMDGFGITGTIDSYEIAVGNLELMENLNISTCKAKSVCDRLEITGHTIVIVAVNHKISMIIGLADQPRATAFEVVTALNELNMNLVMLTGDNQGAASGIAEAVGIEQVHSGMKPKDKLDWIKAKKASVKEKIAMVGDGINDVPSLAAADVGIAVSSAATGMVLNSAHVVLMSDNIVKIASLLSLCKHTRIACILNIFMAIFFKVVVLIAVLFSFMSIWMVILADLFSLVVVIANGLRPLFWKGKYGSWK